MFWGVSVHSLLFLLESKLQQCRASAHNFFARCSAKHVRFLFTAAYAAASSYCYALAVGAFVSYDTSQKSVLSHLFCIVVAL